MIEQLFISVGGVVGEVKISRIWNGVEDFWVLGFIAGGKEYGEFFIDVEPKTETGFSHGTSFRAVNDLVRIFRDRSVIPFETVAQIGVNQWHKFGFGEIRGNIQVDRNEGGVFPEVETDT